MGNDMADDEPEDVEGFLSRRTNWTSEEKQSYRDIMRTRDAPNPASFSYPWPQEHGLRPGHEIELADPALKELDDIISREGKRRLEGTQVVRPDQQGDVADTG